MPVTKFKTLEKYTYLDGFGSYQQYVSLILRDAITVTNSKAGPNPFVVPFP